MNLPPRTAVVIDYARSAMGRSKNGCFRQVRADTLSAGLVQGLLARNPAIAPEAIDDILWGCVLQQAEQGGNIARTIGLLAGLPHSVPAQTVSRLCGSSMTALHTAVANIGTNLGDIYLVGGVEHLGHIPMSAAVDPNPLLGLSVAGAAANMGLTSEYLARIHGINREQMDAHGARSHRLAAKARAEGRFRCEIIPLPGHDADGFPILVEHDETIRPETTIESLADLKPVFDPVHGRITAGTSSQFSDGASVMLIMSAERARDLDLHPLARVVSLGLAGVDPSIMGYGPVPATEKALKRAGLKMDDIEAMELNEAFSAQVLAVLKGMGMLEALEEKVNLNGGAIALGHPFGCSGVRITGALLTVMRERDLTLGAATMCVGFGQGITTILERLR